LLLVYDQRRRLATAQVGRELAGLTLQPTAQVNEAYLRMVWTGSGGEPRWDSRGHFFAAAARAMHHILVEPTRRRGRVRHGAGVSHDPLISPVFFIFVSQKHDRPDGVRTQPFGAVNFVRCVNVLERESGWPPGSGVQSTTTWILPQYDRSRSLWRVPEAQGSLNLALVHPSE